MLAVKEGIEKEKGRVEVEVPRLNTGSNVEVFKSPISNKKASKIVDFVMICKLYIRMRISEVLVEKQI